MTPKQIKAAEKVWADRSKYLMGLFGGPSDIREETEGEDFRHQYVAIGDSVLIATRETGEMHQGIVWKIMGFGRGCRNYFIFVPKLGRVLIRSSSYLARDISG